MYLKIGNTKLLAGKYSVKGLAKIEINFEYLFSSHKSDRRFANLFFTLTSKFAPKKIAKKLGMQMNVIYAPLNYWYLFDLKWFLRKFNIQYIRQCQLKANYTNLIMIEKK